MNRYLQNNASILIFEYGRFKWPEELPEDFCVVRGAKTMPVEAWTDSVVERLTDLGWKNDSAPTSISYIVRRHFPLCQSVLQLFPMETESLASRESSKAEKTQSEKTR
jgi:hypothetical protein